jgi:hypothetical protein
MSGIVTVACKHPNGLHLEVNDKDGNKQRVTIRGNAVRANEIDARVGGYALTTVDADFWAAWHKEFANTPLVKEGIVFALAKEADTKAKAEEQSEIEDINPRLKTDAVKGVEKAED